MQASSSAAAAAAKPLPTTETSLTISPTSASAAATASVAAAAAPTSIKSADTSARRTECDPNCEIEEISKKISEHADAIYRTWKCRGLVPAELFNFYTSAAAVETAAGNTAADFFAASKAVVADNASSAEGLQQLVQTFVINDKQQRSAKSSSMSNSNNTISSSSSSSRSTNTNTGKHKKDASLAATTTTTATKAVVGLKNQKAGSALLKQTKAATPPTSAILLPENTATGSATASTTTTTTTTVTVKATSKIHNEKSPKKTSTTTAIANKLSTVGQRNAGASEKPSQDASAGKVLQQQQQQQQHYQSTGNNHKYAKDMDEATLLNLDLAARDLNVNDLMQLQSQNLLKIKELLQQKSVAAAAVEKPKKMSKTATSAPTENKGKRITLNENVIENVATATATATTAATIIATTMSTPMTTTTSATATAARRTTAVMSNRDKAKIAVDNAVVVVVGSAVDKNSNFTKKANNTIAAATTAILVANNKALPTNQPTAAANSISISNVSNENRDKTKTDEMKIEKARVIKMSNSSNSNSSSNSNKSNSNSTSSNNNSSTNNKNHFNKSDSKSQNSSSSSSSSNGSDKNNNNSSNNGSDNNNNNSSNNNNSNNTSKNLGEQPASPSTTAKNTSKALALMSAFQTEAAETAEAEAAATVTAAAAAAAAATTATVTRITTTPTTTLASGGATSSSSTASENGTEAARASMPAPAKVKTSRLVTPGQDRNLGRPILTRGSVAERVLMFEKCPDVRQSFLNIKRPDPADAPPRSLLKVKLHANPPPPPEQNLLQKEIRISGRSVYIPRFYFPHGKPQPQIAIERTLRGILSAFDSFPNNQVTKDELPRILKLCGLPYYWRMPVMVFCQHGQSGLVERQRFVEFWKQMNVYCHDNASRFVYILSRGQRFRSFILPEDLAPLVQDVVDTHPGLAFLKEATEFHSRYVHTVIARIFYSVNRSWSGKMSISELKRSDLLEIITLLEEEDDINQIMAFFSYEHFYVIYCKFWELDRDHDLLINQDDLARYSDHALSSRIIERIFSGCVTRNDNKKASDDEPKMSYTDFVWFLLSEEDKRTPTAIEYWFRCMDMDGDGLLSMYELEYFYEEQQQRMESIGIETLPFEDCLCQMLDMIKPLNRDCITLGDLKRCKMTHVFFDTFFNLEKYLDHEQRDPFASQRDEYTSDWDRFAAQEYELLITEENE